MNERWNDQFSFQVGSIRLWDSTTFSEWLVLAHKRFHSKLVRLDFQTSVNPKVLVNAPAFSFQAGSIRLSDESTLPSTALIVSTRFHSKLVRLDVETGNALGQSVGAALAAQFSFQIGSIRRWDLIEIDISGMDRNYPFSFQAGSIRRWDTATPLERYEQAVVDAKFSFQAGSIRRWDFNLENHIKSKYKF